jgi:hypothetical protein
MGKRRREDLTVARRLSAQFDLGDVRGVTRSRADQQYRERFVASGGAAIPGLVAILLLIVFAFALPYVALPVAAGVTIITVTAVLGVGYYAGQVILNHSFAPGTDTDRVFWFAGGLAHLTSASPEPVVLPWDGVDSVTATIVDEHYQYYACTLRGSTGTEVTVAGLDDGTVGRAPSLVRRLLRQAGRLFDPRLVPPLIGTYESGQPVVIGEWTVDRTGIRRTASGFVVDRCPWPEITRITMERSPPKTGRVLRIGVHRDGNQPPVAIDLSDVPNGIFLPAVIAHAAADHGVTVHVRARQEQPLQPVGPDSSLPGASG